MDGDLDSVCVMGVSYSDSGGNVIVCSDFCSCVYCVT